jgi:hypothetical protein
MRCSVDRLRTMHEVWVRHQRLGQRRVRAILSVTALRSLQIGRIPVKYHVLAQ